MDFDWQLSRRFSTDSRQRDSTVAGQRQFPPLFPRALSQEPAFQCSSQALSPPVWKVH